MSLKINVQLNSKAIWINGKKEYLRSGAVQYWRIKRIEWEDRVKKAEEGGLNCIETYIPWFFHEPEEGYFDFNGRTLPERDLINFIKLINEHGLYLIARVGPFINAELRYGGYPRWLFKNYPEVISKKADGEPSFWADVGIPAPSQLHPQYLKLVRRWYENVIPILVENSIQKGGPIILFQPDNEPNLVFTYGLDESLYDLYIIGDEKSEGLWHKWLVETYGNLEKINERYGSKYNKISEIKPPRTRLEGIHGLRRTLDWLRFKQWFVFTYLQTLANWAKELGLQLPYMINEPINRLWIFRCGEYATFSKFMKEKNEVCFPAGHCYFFYGKEQDLTGIPITISRIEMVKSNTLDGPNFLIETGSWYDLPHGNLSLYNWDIMLRTLIACGLDGFNIYMYAGGYNAKGDGRVGKSYDWSAPIRADGSLHDSYWIVKRINDFIHSWKEEILSTKKVADVQIAIFSELPLLGKFCHDSLHINFGGKEFIDDKVFSQVHNNLVELVKVLTALNINFEFTYLNDPNKPPDQVKYLIVPNPWIIPSEGFKFIKKVLENGGKVLFYPTIPIMNTDFEKNDTITELLRVKVNKIIPEAGRKADDIKYRCVSSRKVDEAPVDGKIYIYEPHEEAEILCNYEGEVCVFKQKCLNGEVIVSGIFPIYLAIDTQNLFKEIFLEHFEIERNCYDISENLLVIQRGRSEPILLFVSNLLGISKGTKLKIKTNDGIITFPKKSMLEMQPKSSRLLWLNMNLKHSFLKYCTSELIPINNERNEFLAYGDQGTVGEIAFDKKIKIRINEKEGELTKIDDLWIATYEHFKEPTKISLIP
jgi:beta-galactosidase